MTYATLRLLTQDCLAQHTATRTRIPLDTKTSNALQEEISLLLHHDTITGTSKQYVIDDHVQRIETLLNSTALMLAERMMRLVESTHKVQLTGLEYFTHESLRRPEPVHQLGPVSQVLFLVLHNPSLFD